MAVCAVCSFNICHRVLVRPEIFWLVLVKGTATKTPLSQQSSEITPLSFYSAGAVNIYGASAVNVYPLQNDPPPAHWWCSLVCPVGLVWKAFEFGPIATRGLCRFLPICPSLPFSVSQGSKEGCSLSGFGYPCFP